MGNACSLALFKLLAVALWAQAAMLACGVTASSKGQRSFVIDYENNRYLKDGEPIQIVSGSMHSFRTLPEQWDERLATMRAAGLNAIQTYVEWSSHEPEEGHFYFEGQQDIVHFIRLAQKNDLLVLLRPGPYIDAERDLGGLPYWLLAVNRSIGLRTSDPSYIGYVQRYFSKLLPLIRPLLYASGGPIVAVQIVENPHITLDAVVQRFNDAPLPLGKWMFQMQPRVGLLRPLSCSGRAASHIQSFIELPPATVENEYGSYAACDFVYTAYLRDLMRYYLGDDVILYTTDGDADEYLKCGKLDGAYTTVDFGTGYDVGAAFAVQRRHQERGPLVDSEYYMGWMDHWAEPHSVVSTEAVVSQLDKMLSMNASVNLYVFHGGTSFGYKSGALSIKMKLSDIPVDTALIACTNIDDKFHPTITSYDFNAPMTEAGDPTDKYYAIRKTIGKYLPLPPGPVPQPKGKMTLGPFELQWLFGLSDLREMLSNATTASERPLTFEEVGQSRALVLYDTWVSFLPRNPGALSVPGLHDRGYVYVDDIYQGVISRMDNVHDIMVSVTNGQRLTLLVESQGRNAYGNLNDAKGIVSDVTLSGITLTSWNITPVDEHKTLLGNRATIGAPGKVRGFPGYGGFAAYEARFPLQLSPPLDTFLRLDYWKKGAAFLNGFNLGRYWTPMGPQKTLYVPSVLFKAENVLNIFELEQVPCWGQQPCIAEFVDTPEINATVPLSSTPAFRKRGK